jgi:hypothetical protein
MEYIEGKEITVIINRSIKELDTTFIARYNKFEIIKCKRDNNVNSDFHFLMLLRLIDSNQFYYNVEKKEFENLNHEKEVEIALKIRERIPRLYSVKENGLDGFYSDEIPKNLTEKEFEMLEVWGISSKGYIDNDLSSQGNLKITKVLETYD